ncbi:hypothetical protein E2C01_019292 [Portunus trituberculatus]|uniref:Uncharacterized protein n=1 Tax=Portunus trituberculatus TaxID=210409 RepID=A0A5B7DYG6_PORTR|nr:hypothetical protein [Portunus trituberculatus]
MGETLLQTLLIISMAFENSCGEREEQFLRCFYILEAELQDFHFINWRNTLENSPNHFCGLGKQS